MYLLDNKEKLRIGFRKEYFEDEKGKKISYPLPFMIDKDEVITPKKKYIESTAYSVEEVTKDLDLKTAHSRYLAILEKIDFVNGDKSKLDPQLVLTIGAMIRNASIVSLEDEDLFL